MYNNNTIMIHLIARLLLLVLLITFSNEVIAFSFQQIIPTSTTSKHHYHHSSLFSKIDNNNNNNNNSSSDESNDEDDKETQTIVDVYTPMLNQRLSQLRATILSHQIQKPPNPLLSPEQLITAVLAELREEDPSTISDDTSTSTSTTTSNTNYSSSLPDSGYRILLRSSTHRWKEALRKSVGAPIDATEEQLVSALSSAMSRPNNQYEILVSSEEEEDYANNNDDDKKTTGTRTKYHLYFPSDVFYYDEGKAWVETQLRHPKTGMLLCILAWGLIQRKSNESDKSSSSSSISINNDGAWLIDELDWQDFRDEFRPGIGREEWSRICG